MNEAPRWPRFSRAFLLASFLLAAAPWASSQWLHRGAPEPAIGPPRVYLNHPAPGSNTLIIPTEGGGLFRAVDSGGTVNWTRIRGSGLPTGRLIMSGGPPSSPDDQWWVTTEGFGIFTTFDGGATWQPLNGSGPNVLGCLTVTATSSPYAGSRLAGTSCPYGSGIYKTTDGMQTWSRLGAATMPDNASVTAIVSGGPFTNITVATANYGILVSMDSGSTWAQSNAGLPGSNPNVASIMQVTGGVIAFVQGDGVYKKTTGDWAKSTGLPSGAVMLGNWFSTSGVSPPVRFFVGIEGHGIYVSSDSGDTWSLWGNTGAYPETRMLRMVRAADTIGNAFYLFGEEGVIKATNDGATLSPMSQGLEGGAIGSLLHDADDRKVAYALTVRPLRIGDVYASDYDTVSTYIGSGIAGSARNGVIRQDPSSHDVLYVTTDNNGVFKSANRGSSWTAINTGLPSMIGRAGRLAIAQWDTQVLYLGLPGGGGVHKSTDGGANWSAMNAGLGSGRSRSVNAIAVHPADASLAYIATGGGLYKTTDAGLNWSAAYTATDGGSNLLAVRQVRLNPANPAQVLIATSHSNPDASILASSGVHRTSDGGSTWTQLLSGKRAEALEVLADGTIIVGLAEAPGQPAVLRSIDGGATWAPFSTGLLGSDIRAFGVDPTRAGVVTLSLEDGFYTDLGTYGFSSVTGGGYHTCGRTLAGGAKCWGQNANGTLGDNTTTDRLEPVNVSGLASGVAAIAAGWSHSCAATAAGAAKCWGINTDGQLGDNGIAVPRSTVPVDVSGLSAGVTAIAAGHYHSCAVVSGAARCWGWNGYGQLGDNRASGERSLVPVGVSGLSSGVAAVGAGGYYSCALTTGGAVKCWGNNANGQLGDNQASGTTYSAVPVDVSGLSSGVAALTVGVQHACALTTAGGVKCWGSNGNGQAGDGTTGLKLTPADVPGLTTGVISVAAGHYHTCAVTAGGAVKCWGYNLYGQLGDNSVEQRTTPVDVAGLSSGATKVTAGHWHSCALMADGSVRCWGRNDSGQLGDNSTAQRPVPAKVDLGVSPFILEGAAIAVTMGEDGAPTAFALTLNATDLDGDALTWSIASPASSGLASVPAGTGTSKVVGYAPNANFHGTDSFTVRVSDGTLAASTVVTVHVMSSNDAPTLDAIADPAAVASNAGIQTVGLAGISTGPANESGQAITPSITAVGNPSIFAVQPSATVTGATGTVTYTPGSPGTSTVTVTLQDNGGTLQGGVDTVSRTFTVTFTAPPNVAPVIAQGESVGVSMSEDSAPVPFALTLDATDGDGNPLSWSIATPPANGIASVPGGSANSVSVGYTPSPNFAGADSFVVQVSDGTATDAITVNVTVGPVNDPPTMGDPAWVGFPLTPPGNAGRKTAAITGITPGPPGELGQVLTISVTEMSNPDLFRGVSAWISGTTGGVNFTPATHGTSTITVRVQDDGGTGFGGGDSVTRTFSVTFGAQVLPPLTSTREIAAGGFHTCAKSTTDGALCWGDNEYGQLGDNTLALRHAPVFVSGAVNGVTSISSGNTHSCMVNTTAGAMCWGNNSNGQLGDGTTTNRLVPTMVQGLESGIAAVVAGANHSCALTQAGGVKCWGYNGQGQLGNGTTDQSVSPVDVVGLGSGVIAIGTGPTASHTCAILTGGALKCWGNNINGQLGDGTTANRSSPVPSGGFAGGIAAVVAGSMSTCALTDGGAVKCWGGNASGQLGDGTTTQRVGPVDVQGLSAGVAAISAGESHACALLGGAGVKCWGGNGNAQIGDGTTTRRTTPVDVPELATAGVTRISAGRNHACAVTASHEVRCWGANTLGQLGDNVVNQILSPGPLVALLGNVTSMATSGSHACAVTAGSLRCWGDNDSGQLGNGLRSQRSTPADVIGFGAPAASVVTGQEFTCARTAGGGVKCWGLNASGQLGNGTNVDTQAPVDVTGLGSGVTSIATSANAAHACAITAGGGMKCWGANGNGQLGDGSTTSSNAPVDVFGLASGVIAIAVGQNHTCAITTGGALQCWGANGNGQLGNGTQTQTLVPGPVTGLGSGVTSVSAGASHTCAVVATGVKCWGGNVLGQSGQSSGGMLTTPADVTGLTSGVTGVSAGNNHTCALKSGGVVSCWGANRYGQLGDGGQYATRYSPADVSGSATGVTAVSSGNVATCALRGDGGVACWGVNQVGALGEGSVAIRGFPAPVLGNTVHYLGVSKLGTGSGTVSGSPAGIDCGPDCAHAYGTGTVVNLAAGAAAGSTFAGWSGCDSVNASNQCVVTMANDRVVIATFTLQTHALTVSRTGSGMGTVSSSPAGISCGDTCSAGFGHGVVVTLTPTASTGSVFAGWSGACSGTDACQVTMTEARGVTAIFDLDPVADADHDGIPNGVEIAEGRNPLVKDNDIFSPGAGAARLFAMQMYRDFLNREGDPAGIQGWADAVAAGSWSRLQVIDGFLQSQEFAGFVAPVVRLYFATFLRVPDYDGLTFNAGLVRAGTVTLTQLADFFTASPEFQATYGTLDNAAFVTLLYNNVLGRAPDPAGLSGWVALLNGGYTRGQVLLGFSDSVEYQAAMANEVFVTMMYAGMLRRTPEPSGFTGWVSFLDAGTYTREQVINGFFLSTEYRGRFLP